MCRSGESSRTCRNSQSWVCDSPRQVAKAALRSHPLPSGGQRWIKPPPSGDRWLPRQVAKTALRSHPLPSGGRRWIKPPPSGDRWLPRQVAKAALRSHPLPSGGRRWIKPPPSGDRWLPRQVATANAQAMGPRSLYPVPTSDAEIASDVHARHNLHHPVNQGLRRYPHQARTPDHPKGDGQWMLGGF